MLVLIGIPTPNTIEPECLKAIYGQEDAGVDTALDIVYGYKVDIQRRQLCEEAIRIGADYLLMVDSDVVLPDTALKDLLDPQADIVTGIYRLKKQRRNGDYTIAFKDQGGPILYQDMPEGRMRITKCGAGCLLIKTSVLKKIPHPWWLYTDEMGEDFWFCQQAAKAGVEIYADKRVACGHIIKEQYCFGEGF